MDHWQLTSAAGKHVKTDKKIPFDIPANGRTWWGGNGSQARKLAFACAVNCPVRVYTVMGGGWGDSSRSRAKIRFVCRDGTEHAVDLMCGVHFRDHNNNPSYPCNVDDKLVTRAVFGHEHNRRLDMQRFDLPDKFHSRTLSAVILEDNGAEGQQRVMIAAATVERRLN